ncbi:MAG: N-acyl amino acid synthase FeeM domain-containing protein [Sulfuricella sp.]
MYTTYSAQSMLDIHNFFSGIMHGRRKADAWNMLDIRKFFLATKKRRRKPDEWDKTIITFSPNWLKDLALPAAQDVANLQDDKAEQQVFKVRLANNEDRRKAASLLIQKMYDWRGYDTDALSHDPNKITLAAYLEDKVAGTMSLGIDSPQGLVVDQLYKQEADQLRAEGRKLCDITRLAVDHDIKSKSVLAALFHMSFIYGHNIHHATDFLIEVNPRHVLFYQRMMGFEPFGEEKTCPRVNAPAVLMRLDATYADEQIIRYGGMGATAAGVKSIYPYFFSHDDELGITQRLLRGE